MPHAAVPRFITARARWLAWLCILGAFTAPVSRMLTVTQVPTLQWLVELAAHWQWPCAVVGAISLGVLVLARPRGIMGRGWSALAVLALGGSFLWQPALLPRGTEPSSPDAVLTVGSANLNASTTDFGPLTAWLASPGAPDVVLLQEFTELTHQALVRSPAVAARYPHRLAAPQPDPFGLAVLSRHPLSDLQTLQPQDPRDTLRLRATVAWNGRAVHLSALHPMPPLDEGFAQARDRALVQEAGRLAQAGGLALLAGDLNTTPWARSLFTVEATLRRANGVAPSWPNAFGWLSVLPLDHVLASSGWQVLDSRIGPDLGSDHRPVVVRLVVAP
ncbi:MAG: endonuclease/exonuclease/phosphatase family protein [Pseudomonadota bacterium]